MKLKYEIAIVGMSILLVTALPFRDRAPSFVRTFFTEATSPFNLAIFRIIFFLLVLFSFSVGNTAWFGDLPTELRFPPTGLQFILAHVPISEPLARAASIALVVVCLSCIVGLFTRTSTIICLVLSLYVLGLPQFFGKINHNHHLIWFMAILAASPCADVLSLDAVWKSWRRADRGTTAPPEAATAYGLPLRFILLLMGVIYFSAGFWKVWTAGYHWAWSDNPRNIMYNKWMELAGWMPIFRIDQYPLMYKVSALGTLMFELSFIFLIFSKRLRVMAPLGGLAFHSVTNLFMKIWFWNLQGCYAAFVNWSALFRWIGQRLFPHEMYVLYDRNCKLCRRTIASFRMFDLCERVTYVNALDGAALRAHQLSWLDADRLMRHMHVVMDRNVWTGFAAYREWIKRLPCLWLALPFMYLPPVAFAGNRIYERVAGSRTCSLVNETFIPQLSSTRSGRAVTVMGSLLIYVTIISAVAKLQSWPMAVYPTFEDLDKPEVSILTMTAQDASGTSSVLTPIKDQSLKQLTAERLMGLQNRLVSDGDEDQMRRRLKAFWQLLVQENPSLGKTATVRFYRDTVSSLPEDRDHIPLRHELLWEMRVDSPVLATR
jgi:predicted DCC family thiol-disulfide oxidoreductase YuxK